MGRFLTDAGHLLDTARAETDSELMPRDLAILVDRGGTIRMLDAEGWHTQALQADSGAATVYRISRDRGRVRVEGRSGTQSCVLETETPAAAARRLLGC